MRSRVLFLLAVGVVGAVVTSVVAFGDKPGDNATGGGQVMVGNRGAGDTIAFVAQSVDDAMGARGQVQYVDRNGGTGQGQEVFHGEVACIVVQGAEESDTAEGAAFIAGTWRDGGPFQLYVEDGGEPNQGRDVVTVISMADEPTCDFDPPEEEDQTALARGNVQVRDNP